MRFLVALLTIVGAAQSPSDTRNVLIATARKLMEDPHVTTMRLYETGHTRAVADSLGARMVRDTVIAFPPRKLSGATGEVEAYLRPATVRGDSAFLQVIENTTINGRPFTSVLGLALVKRAGVWVVTKFELGAIS